MTCTLLAPRGRHIPESLAGNCLAGSLVSSLHRLKDGTDPDNNRDAAYFIFPDISVKLEGTYYLRFDLYEIRDTTCIYISSVTSDSFRVFEPKSWPGMGESTSLTRMFADQGVRIRLRKEPRTLLKKRGPADDDYRPRVYRKNQTSQQLDKEPDTGNTHQSDVQQSPIQRNLSNEQSLSRPLDQFGRRHADRSSDYGELGRYDGPLAKRPRTGSDQCEMPSFGNRNLSLSSPQFNTSRTDMESPQSAGPYTEFAQQQSQTFSGYTFNQTPQVSYASQASFGGDLQSDIGTTSFFEQDPQRPTHFGLYQQPQVRRESYGQINGFMPRPSNVNFLPSPQTQTYPNIYSDNYGLSGRAQISTSLLGHNAMAPPSIAGRLGSSLNLDGFSLPSNARREMNQIPSQDISAGGFGDMLQHRASTSMSTTSGPSLGAFR